MNSAANDLAIVLNGDSSVGLTYGTDLFVAEKPIGATYPCAVCYDSGGDDPEVNYTYERPHVQVRVWGAPGAYSTAHALVQAITETLHGYANQTVGSTRYVGIWQVGGALFLGLDNDKRPMFSVNFRIHRTE